MGSTLTQWLWQALPVHMRNKEIAILYLNVVLYAFCYQLVQPAQLSVVKSLTEGEEAQKQFAWVKSFNGVAQLVGSLTSGILIDRFGCQSVLLISFVASGLCYALLGMASDISFLYLAQIPTIFQHAILAARAQISMEIDDVARPAYLGYVGVAYGIGFVVGPSLGGWLAKISLSLPAWLAVAGSILSIALSFIGYKKSEPKATPAKGDDAPKGALNSYARIWKNPFLVSQLAVSVLG